MTDLSEASDSEIVAELERRAGAGNPVLAACPSCERTDAWVAVYCADHGAALFPVRPRIVAEVAASLQPLLRRAAAHGITYEELGLGLHRELAPATPGQIRAFHAVCNEIDAQTGSSRGDTKVEAKRHASALLGRTIAHVNELNEAEMGLVLDWLDEELSPGPKGV